MNPGGGHLPRRIGLVLPSVGGTGLAAMLAVFAPAAAATVDQLTCTAAQAAVQTSGRYDKRTGFGVVPIIPPRRLATGRSADCPIGSSPSFYVERTTDAPACILGYSCERRDNR